MTTFHGFIKRSVLVNTHTGTAHDPSDTGRSLCGYVAPVNPPWPWEGEKAVGWNAEGMKGIVLIRGVRLDDFPSGLQCQQCRYIIQEKTKAFSGSFNREYWLAKEAVPC